MKALENIYWLVVTILVLTFFTFTSYGGISFIKYGGDLNDWFMQFFGIIMICAAVGVQVFWGFASMKRLYDEDFGGLI